MPGAKDRLDVSNQTSRQKNKTIIDQFTEYNYSLVEVEARLYPIYSTISPLTTKIFITYLGNNIKLVDLQNELMNLCGLQNEVSTLN